MDVNFSRLIEDPLPDEQELVREYDSCFSLNPNIWSGESRDEYIYNMLKLFCRFAGRRLSGTLLDVGCGNGHTLLLFEEKAKEIHPYGIDLSKEAIKIAASRLKRTQLIRGNFLEHQFSEKFNVILGLGTFEHFEDPLKALQRAKSMLSDDGILYLELPANLDYGWSGNHEGFRRLSGGSRQVEWHLRRKTWEHIINSAGFEILMGIKGPEKPYEFIWLLSSRPTNMLQTGLVRLLTIYLWLKGTTYRLINDLLSRILPVQLLKLIRNTFGRKHNHDVQ